jgi:hypothetical protein
MINKHIISIEFGSNSFYAACDINQKNTSLKEKILMNWNVQDEWYNGKKKHKASNKLSVHLLGIFNLEFLYLHLYNLQCIF